MSYKKYNDYELIYMVRENDDNSYDEIFTKYYPIIKNMAYSYYSRFKNYGHDLDDFVQEALIAFYNALNSYSDNKNSLFYSYAILCIERKLISFTRKISCVTYSIPYSFVSEYDEKVLYDKSNSFTSIYDEMDAVNVLKSVIFDIYDDNSSSKFDSYILELKYNNFTYSEISILLDIPIRLVQTRLNMIRKYLRKKVYS